MDQNDQAKLNLILHIETNRTFIEQKMYDSFKMECLQQKQLGQLSREKIQEHIKQIFDFGKSEKMSGFYSLIPQNIVKFIKNKYEDRKTKDDVVTDIEKLLQIVIFCVQNGFKKKIKRQIVPIQKLQQINQPIQIEEKQIRKTTIKSKVPDIVVKPRYLDKKVQKPNPIQIEKIKEKPKTPKTPQITFVLPKYSMPDKNVGPRYLTISQDPVVKKIVQQPKIQVNPLDSKYIQKHKRTLDQRLLKLYQFYCSQQQNVGKNATFDRIKGQCNQMNIGKFLLFCKNTQIFDEKIITRQKLIQKYKKISEGKKQIQFEDFKRLMKTIDEQYIMKQSESNNEKESIATYEARLFLNSPVQYKHLKKDVDLPFSTRDKNPRQIPLKFYNIQAKKITQEDAFAMSLRYLSQIAQRRRSPSEKTNPNQTMKKSIVRLDQLKQQKISVIHNLIMQEDQADDMYLLDYRLNNVVGKLHKRVGQLQKIQSARNRPK